MLRELRDGVSLLGVYQARQREGFSFVVEEWPNTYCGKQSGCGRPRNGVSRLEEKKMTNTVSEV